MTTRNKIRLFAFVLCVLGLFFKIAIVSVATAQMPVTAPAPALMPTPVPATPTLKQAIVALGEAIALDPLRGNCNACHQLPNTQKATGKSKIGVSLNQIRTKFPDDKTLRALIWNASVNYPQTIMPPYGKHRILSETEIDDLIAWLVTQ